MAFKVRFKLEFDIETNLENMQEVLNIITDNIAKEFNEKIDEPTQITYNAKIIRLGEDETEKINKRIEKLIEEKGVTMD